MITIRIMIFFSSNLNVFLSEYLYFFIFLFFNRPNNHLIKNGMNDNTDEIIENEEVINLQKRNSFFSKITLIVFVLSSLLFYFDLGPPLPPYYSWFKTDDCYSLKFESFTNNNGILNFSFYADETYELPREYLPNLIKIQGVSSIVNVTYFGARHSNRTQKGNFVNIVVPFHFISSFDFLITCLSDMKLAEFHENITTIDDDRFDGSSKSTQIGPKEELFEHVCLEKKMSLAETLQLSNYNPNPYYTFKFFSYLDEQHSPFQFSNPKNSKKNFDFKLDFECEKHHFNEFISARNIKSERGDCILSPPLDENLWQLILFDLPEIENVRVWSDFDSFDLIVPKVTSSTSLVQSTIYDLQQIQCFDSMTIANFRPNVSVNKEEDSKYIWDVLDQNFTNFREKYVFNYSDKSVKIIAISNDKILDDFRKTIENICIKSSFDCSVSTFQNNQTNELTDMLSKASILIGNHITNLAPMVLMNKGSNVIDFSNKKYACNNWAKKFAQKFSINYYSYYENENCECKNFSKCYPEFPEKVEIDDYNNIKDLILKLLEK